ncbi:MAG: DUF4174 domain-containing protein [Paracoccaceae bacterium]|jgi:hypothetical protein|nr:DUF4174 domain-containing protein [Paracoccaceae bacterium]
MKAFLILLLVLGMPYAASAQVVGTAPGPLPVQAAQDVTPDALMWQARPVVVFADTPQQPQFAQQMRLLSEDPEPLLLRDVVIITDTNPAAMSVWREKLRPRGFSLVLMDKDGAVVIRKPLPWSVREIIQAIDRMPIRRDEIRSGSGKG